MYLRSDFSGFSRLLVFLLTDTEHLHCDSRNQEKFDYFTEMQTIESIISFLPSISFSL